jgi:hypothetical protein
MRRRWLVRALLLALLLGLPVPSAAQQIGSILSGFTVVNLTGQPANDFHVVVSGMGCGEVLAQTAPPGWSFNCTAMPNGDVVLNWVGGPPVQAGQSGSFGLQVAGSPPWRIVCAYWTQGWRVLFPMVTWPNQRWDADPGQWVDIVDGYRPPVSPNTFITREWTPVPIPIPLPQLTWDLTADLPWQPSGLGPEIIPNMPDSFFDIFLEAPGAPAALVRYPVTDPATGLTTARYTNQVTTGMFGPVQMFSNFDAVNRSDICVNDFHVVLSGVTCGQLMGGTQGLCSPPGWIATCMDLPFGQGCVINWMAVDGSCVFPGDMRHFGYGLSGIPNFRITAAYWTWNGVPVPPFVDVIQQTWEPDPFWPGRWIDRVWGYPPLVESGGVTIRRDWAWLPQPLPLETLTWSQTLDLPWIQADEIPQWIPPNPAFEIPFVFPLLPDGAARLIRYEVLAGAGPSLMTFVNQAIPVFIPPPPPPIQDLRIEYLGQSEEGVGHFRLLWTPPPGPGSPLVYRVYGYTDPYDPTTGSELGFTVDSFFDVFLEVGLRVQAPPTCFRVTSEALAPQE